MNPKTILLVEDNPQDEMLTLRAYWLVVRSAKTVTNEMDGFFRQARRRPAAVCGIRQGAVTTPGGKIRRFMSLFWRNGLLATNEPQ